MAHACHLIPVCGVRLVLEAEKKHDETSFVTVGQLLFVDSPGCEKNEY